VARCAWALVLIAWPALVWGQQPVLPEDVEFTGSAIHAYPESGQTVTVVLGNFEMNVGQRTIAGRDAVIWSEPIGQGQIAGRTVTVYVERNARVVEPSGAVTRDERMLVTFQHQGRLVARGHMEQRPLRDLPLVRRARQAMDAERKRQRPRPRPQAPPLRVREVTEPEPPAPPAPPTDEPNEPATRPAPPPAPPEPVVPVYFRADKFESRPPADPDDPNSERITIARGGVYLTQGDPATRTYLELRSREAVLFSREGPEDANASPVGPLGEVGMGGQQIVGAYLEGDVVLAMGDRFVRARRAYYDFLANRAILLDTVFRTVQEQRNIPIYIRARKSRVLSRREMWFRNAKVSTSEFHTPTYHLGARTAYVMDTTPRTEDGEPLDEQSLRTELRHATVNVRGVPFLYWPYTLTDMKQDHTALRKIEIGGIGGEGAGVQTEWHLFRMLGLVRPEGFEGRYFLTHWCDKGEMTAASLRWNRERYGGFIRGVFLYDDSQKADLAELRRDIVVPETRGRLLMRHKQLLADDWLLQLELSYLCDPEYLEEFSRTEFYAGKKQETLAYAKKSQDNWAVTALAKGRVNRFMTQDLSAPDLGLHLVGQPLLDGLLTFFHEARAGYKRYHVDDRLDVRDERAKLREPLDLSSRWFTRFDTRNEINLPLHLGPVNVTPYATGRVTYWDDEPERIIPRRTRQPSAWWRGDEFREEGQKCRLFGQVGVKASTSFWRVYDVQNRLLGLDRLRHIVTPEGAVFAGSNGGVLPKDLYPLDPDVESDLHRLSGGSIAIRQRLQTKRGPRGRQHTVDWMRLDLEAGFYDNGRDPQDTDGRFFMYRPEYSLGRDHINGKYLWNVADGTAFMAETNFDLESKDIAWYTLGLSVQRAPRLKYYFSWRAVKELDSAVGTVGVDYRVSEKYTLRALEQYEFDHRDTRNLITRFSIIRKLPRWNVAVTLSYDRSIVEQDEVSAMVSVWPEGIGEVQLGGERFELLGKTDEEEN
jgi:hypothetical protein